jgi:hypothetical protein
MDLGYAMDRPYRPIPPELAGAAQRVASFLGGSGRAVVVTGPAGSGKRALLDGLLAGMPGRITRIENRTGLPLALDGVLKQMGKVAETEGDERGLFFRTLAEQAYDDYSAVIAVEDAHTLTSLALSALARAPGLGGPDLPGMILVLTGEAGLLAKLDGPGLEGLRNPRRTLTIMLPGPGGAVTAGCEAPAFAAANAAPVRAVVPAPGGAEPEVGWARGNLGMRGVVIAVFAGAIAAGGGLTWSLLPHVRRGLPAVPAAVVGPVTPVTPVTQGPAPATTQPVAPAPPAAAAAEAPVADPAVLPDALSPPALAMGVVLGAAAEEALRREFDAFLNRAGRDTAKLTPAARETLFREYQQWRAREAGRVP